jgi:hypothetical protein
VKLTKGRDLKILDFDCECRPIAWYGGDFVTKQPTAIAWSVVGSGDVTVRAIGESYDARNVLDEEAAMLYDFCRAYEEADVVTGHYIRGFDLPLLNGALIRLGMPGLGSKLAQDTKTDLVKAGGLSKSQENLGAMFELRHPKVSMNTSKWMAANLLLPEGIGLTKERVVGDVVQHMELRERMVTEGLLAPPKTWSAGGGRVEEYTP